MNVRFRMHVMRIQDASKHICFGLVNQNIITLISLKKYLFIYLGDTENNQCFLKIHDEDEKRKAICTFCLAEVKKKSVKSNGTTPPNNGAQIMTINSPQQMWVQENYYCSTYLSAPHEIKYQ